MTIGVTGVNYKTATVSEREQVLKGFQGRPGILLATCNRVELYRFAMRSEMLDTPQLIAGYSKTNIGAIRHLFRVVAGLDSQILGETEILGQVRKAYLANQGKDWLLARVFEKAIEVGRRVRAETRISQGNVSVASTAVAQTVKLLGDDKKKTILLIGTSKVNESIIKTLLKLKFNFIWIANRTFEKASALAREVNGRAVRFDRLEQEIREADLVISSTAAPHLIVGKDQIAERTKPLIVIDLAVPRDVDPKVVGISGVTLLNIDDIKEEINFNLARRKIEAVFAENIVEDEVRKFCEKFALAVAPAA